MDKIIRRKFKKGAASFYIVAFSTLILLILAMSFSAIIISELERTSNDDLSQSAYDSAMAGVEDAKLAFFSYQKCKADGGSATVPNKDGTLTCGEIIWYVENSSDCDVIGRVLGRIEENEEEGKEVVIQESENVSNNMQQAYTCAKLQTVLQDYRSSLSSTNQIRVVKLKFEGENMAQKVKQVKLSWGGTDQNANYANFSDGKVRFPQIGVVAGQANPPTVGLALVQTSGSFNIEDFEKIEKEKTDRGLLYLVPTENKNDWQNKEDTNYRQAVGNHIGKEGFVKSNDKTVQNLPYVVECPGGDGSEFRCTVKIDLPEPINGARNDETFIMVVSLPYAHGNTAVDFAMEFFCGEGEMCATKKVVNEEGEIVEEQTNQLSLDGVQIGIDSTGRANDLYRRIEVRMDSEANSSYLSMMGPLELLGSGKGSGNNASLEKNYPVKKEYNF